MRTFLIITCVAITYSYANSTYAQKLDLDVSDITLDQLFEEIQNRSDYIFFYKDDVLNEDKKISIKLKNASLTRILDKALAKTNLDYSISDRQVVVMKTSTQVSSEDVEPNAKQDQGPKISGQVLDSEGDPLPGATILEKGTLNGTQTDVDGKFSLFVESEESVLVFSFVGFDSQEILVGDQTIVDITMKENAEALDEVVVIGYGTTTKRKLVGAVSKIDTKELQQTPFANVTQALQGQIPGIIVQNSGGGLGKVPDISIRGAGKPLFVIDGVILDEDDNYSFVSLNMEDIASITFLKDASSTAVYGSRAANGIVLVKTKKGQSGKLNLQYSFNQQFSQPTVLPKRLNSYEFAQIQNAATVYDGVEPFYNTEQLEVIRTGSDPDTYPNTDWQKLSLKDYAQEQKHNLSLSGGSEQTDFYVSLGYFEQGGLLKSEAISLERMNIRSNVRTRIPKVGVELGFSLNGSLQNTRNPALGEWTIWNHMARNIPLNRAFNEDGTYAEGVNHPLAQNDRRAGYLKERQKFINTQLEANWQVPKVKGLSTGVMANYRDGDSYTKKWELLAPQYETDGSVYPVSKPLLDVQSGFESKIDFIYNVSYARNIGNHGMDVTLAYNRIWLEGERVQASRRDFLSSSVDQIFAGPADGQSTDGSAFNSANEGYVGRFQYDFASRYILQFSFRYDGNDNFSPSKRWGFFPAIAGAWVVSDEPFMESLYESNVISMLKIRASYGTTGLTDGVNRHGYLPVYNLEPNTYNIGNSLVNGFSEGPLVNPNALTWFKRRSLNYGLDFGLLKNKLEGSFDYFYYKTSGYLQSPDIDYTATLGKDLPQISSNSVQRRAGFEFRLVHKNRIGDFSYNLGVNYAFFNQLWKRLDTENEVTLKNPYTRVTHEKDFYQRTNGSDGGLYISDGFFQSEEDILNSPRPLASTETQLGDIAYKDVNGDGKIDDQDRRRIGLPTFPHGTYGFNFNLGYKGWSLSGLVQGTGDRYTAIGKGYQKGEAISMTLDFQKDYWSPENTDAFFPRISHVSESNGGNNQLDSDHFILNAKYIRLKTLRVGYDLKSSVLKNVDAIHNCNVFVSGVNLLTASKVKDYFDPEDVINQDNSVNGFSGAAYPIQKTYAIGLNVTF
ncbi:MAG: TonB-dependent receptor [Cyclobacteriaceae bacterium]